MISGPGVGVTVGEGVRFPYGEDCGSAANALTSAVASRITSKVRLFILYYFLDGCIAARTHMAILGKMFEMITTVRLPNETHDELLKLDGPISEFGPTRLLAPVRRHAIAVMHSLYWQAPPNGKRKRGSALGRILRRTPKRRMAETPIAPAT